MQANNFFSPARFGGYLKKHLVDNYRYYIMSMVVLAGLLVFFILFMLVTGNVFRQYSALIPFYLIGMFLAGLIFTSMSFNELASKPRGIDYLLLPASHVEKFLCTWLITTIGFLLVYHLAFFLAIKAGAAYTYMRTGQELQNDLARYSRETHWYYGYYCWVIAQAVFLLGAIYFHKYSFVKTMFIFILFILSLYLLNSLFTMLLFGNRIEKWNHQFPFIGVNVFMEGVTNKENTSYLPYKFVTLPDKMQDVLLFTGKYLVAPILWILACFRLKDKEL